MRQQISALISMSALAISVAAAAESDVKVSPVMKTSTTITGQRIEYPDTDKPEMTALIVDIQPGKRVLAICTPYLPMSTSLRGR
jgi:hypothetical protein